MSVLLPESLIRIIADIHGVSFKHVSVYNIPRHLSYDICCLFVVFKGRGVNDELPKYKHCISACVARVMYSSVVIVFQ